MSGEVGWWRHAGHARKVSARVAELRERSEAHARTRETVLECSIGAALGAGIAATLALVAIAVVRVLS